MRSMQRSVCQQTGQDDCLIPAVRKRGVKTARVAEGLSLSVIRLGPSRMPEDRLCTKALHEITGVYGVRLDTPRNTLQILFDGTRGTARNILTLLHGRQNNVCD